MQISSRDRGYFKLFAQGYFNQGSLIIFSGYVEIFEEYSNAACYFECMLKFARNICRCTPWNMPTIPTSEHAGIICDLFGHSCFNTVMKQQYRLEDCDCPSDCSSVKFSLSKKEVPLGPANEHCVSANERVKGRHLEKYMRFGSNLLSSVKEYPKYLQVLHCKYQYD